MVGSLHIRAISDEVANGDMDAHIKKVRNRVMMPTYNPDNNGVILRQALEAIEDYVSPSILPSLDEHVQAQNAAYARLQAVYDENKHLLIPSRLPYPDTSD